MTTEVGDKLQSEAALPQPVRDLLAAAGKARAQLDWEQAIALYTQALEQARSSGQLTATIEYDLLKERAQCARMLGNTTAHDADAQDMVRLAEAAGDLPRQATALIKLASGGGAAGVIAAGQRLLEAAIALARRAGDRRIEADGLVELARVRGDSGQTDPMEPLNQALLLYQQIGDLRGEARCLTLRGMPLSRLGKGDQARCELERAFELARQTGDRVAEARALNVLGIVSTDSARKRDYYEQALAVNALVGDWPLRAIIHNNLSLACAVATSAVCCAAKESIAA